MHFTRCQDQKSRTLDEFYEEAQQSDDHVTHELGRAMLSLLAGLCAFHSDRRVYGLTSLYNLYLLAEDTSRSPWFVRVLALDQHTYHVEYLLPARLAPWPEAYVRGEARSEDEAIKMVVTAMERSEGWAGAPPAAA